MVRANSLLLVQFLGPIQEGFETKNIAWDTATHMVNTAQHSCDNTGSLLPVQKHRTGRCAKAGQARCELPLQGFLLIEKLDL